MSGSWRGIKRHRQTCFGTLQRSSDLRSGLWCPLRLPPGEGRRNGGNLRLVLNQSLETTDIKTGNAVLIPKGSYQAIRMFRKSPPDQTEENYLVVAVQHEGKTVLAGLREAYWRHWEGHDIPEFRVTIREMKERQHHPRKQRP